MKKQLTHVSVLQSGKILGALYFIMGFIYTLFGIPMVILGGPQVKVMGYFYAFMPIILGVGGFICFVIFIALYNLLAKRIGGIEFEVTEVE